MKTVNRNHPIIVRFSGLNHPIPASPCLVTRSESTDIRPIFRRKSTDATAETGRNRPTPGAESSGRPFGPSRHFSRQNGESGDPGSPISGYPAIFPAILRDRGASGDQSAVTSCRSKPWRRLMAKAETYRPIGEIVATARRDSANQQSAGKWQSLPAGQDNLDAIESDARETDKALRKILKQLGV